MDTFTAAYIECALWATNDDTEVSLDENYGEGDIDPATLAIMVEDCRKFQEENADDIATYSSGRWTPEEMAGHDFWLTRNGHGAGFWDGDWPEDAGKRLTEACDRLGECYLYVGDDGRIHTN